jgi:hypothetical protein
VAGPSTASSFLCGRGLEQEDVDHLDDGLADTAAAEVLADAPRGLWKPAATADRCSASSRLKPFEAPMASARGG